jgi:hypothetical protein
MGSRIVPLSQIRRLPISSATQKIALAAIAHREKPDPKAPKEIS